MSAAAAASTEVSHQPNERDITEEGMSATDLDASLHQRLSHAVSLSREEGRHSEAADILGDLIKVA